MIILLGWLTVSAPVVNAAAKAAASNHANKNEAPSGQPDTPFSNTTEEKTDNNASVFSEEFLHDHHPAVLSDLFRTSSLCYHEDERAYTAFHGELLCPPPNC